MRVVFDGRSIQDHFPGIARYAYNLATGLAGVAGSNGLDILVDPTVRNQRYDLDRLARVSGARLRPVAAPIFSPIGQARAARAIRDLRVDLYHSPYYLCPPLIAPHTVVTVFDLISETEATPAGGPGQRLRRFAHHLAVSLALRTSSGAIVPSRQTLVDLQALYAISPARVSVIPLGVEARFGAAAANAIAAIRAQYRLPERFILSVGINKPHKNLARLVAALARVDANIGLVVAGPVDSRYPDGNALARRYQVTDRVRAIGLVPDNQLPALYAAAEIFAFPSLAEGFGLPPLEAMASGTPVVASDSTSLPDILGDAALLFNPLDVEALAVALNRLAAELALRQRFAEAGRRRAAEFTWERAAVRTWRLYEELTGAR